MRNQQKTFLSIAFICIIYMKDYSTGNKIVGQCGSARVFLSPMGSPTYTPWGMSWPEGAILNEISSQSSIATPSIFEDKSFLSGSQRSAKMITPTRRTFKWKAEELVISFNMTKSGNPCSGKLEPPLTWLESPGLKLEILQSSLGFSSKEELSLTPDSSMMKVYVCRKSAESSLNILKKQGFGREDIYRMLNKGPWALAFDLSSALPRLFSNLQRDVGLTQSQAVHVVSHCPFLLAQYAQKDGSDVSKTAKVFLDVGYTLPKLIADVMRFPSMLATPPDRIRGWLHFLQEFGIAKDSALFGKMLKKAPYMLHVDAPHTAGEKRSPVSRVEDYDTDKDHVACNALKVLQLLSSLDLPDLDKVVRTQPLLLLADIQEVNARVDFLFNLCRDSKPSQVGRASPLENSAINERVDSSSSSSSSSKAADFSSNLDSLSSLTKDRIEMPTTPASLTSSTSTDRSTECRGRNKGTELESEAAPIAVTCGGRSRMELVVDVDIDGQRSLLQGALSSSTGELATAPPPPPAAAASSDVETSLSLSQREALEVGLTQFSVGHSTLPAVSSSSSSSSSSKSSEAAAVSRHQDTTVLSKDAFQSNQDAAQKMFGSLLLSYPGVLSIESRQMKAAGNALRTAGLRRNEVLLIARRHPPVLGRDPALLMNLISFLRFTCGLNKADLQPFLFKYPALLGADLAAIEPKANYLFVSLGGSQEMLRRFPSFLSFDLEEHIRPRAEFLRAMKIDPLQNGLAFLVSAPAKEIANIAGVRVEFFNQFQAAYSDLIKKKLNEKLEADKAVISLPATQADNRPFQFSSSILEDSSSERTFLDELDFGF